MQIRLQYLQKTTHKNVKYTAIMYMFVLTLQLQKKLSKTTKVIKIQLNKRFINMYKRAHLKLIKLNLKKLT